MNKKTQGTIHQVLQAATGRYVLNGKKANLVFGEYPLALSAVVSTQRVTDEGAIIAVVEPAWNAILDMIQNDPDSIHDLSWRMWEEMVAASYEKSGFDKVILTPRTGDGGRDIIAVKDGFGSVRLIDQVKAYKPGHLVTANDVRALLGVLHTDRNATKGIVTTTSRFAPGIRSDPSITPHMPYRLELIDGEQLVDRLSNLRKS